MWDDLKSAKWIIAKGLMFILVGILSFALILAEMPSLRLAFLLVICVWAFARAYYFAFYVIEHYIDDTFRYAGLWSAFRYLVGRAQGKRGVVTPSSSGESDG